MFLEVFSVGRDGGVVVVGCGAALRLAGLGSVRDGEEGGVYLLIGAWDGRLVHVTSRGLRYRA